MSDGMNKVMILGNLGADAELRVLPSGEAVCNLRIATTESWLDKETKQKQERTEWHSVAIFGKRGEALSKYLNKGDRVLIEGSLRTKKSEKDGTTYYNTSIVAREVYFAGSAKGGGTAAAPSEGAPSDDTGGDDIPFGGEDDKPAAAAGKGKKK